MAYLNWKNHNIKLEANSLSNEMNSLVLYLDEIRLRELEEEFKVLFQTEDKIPNHELKIELEQGWTLFFRQKLGQSRLTVAHPQEKEWVASLYLTLQHTERFYEALTNNESEIRFSKLSRCAPLSNFELILSKIS
jgi:hypothetical protein